MAGEVLSGEVVSTPQPKVSWGGQSWIGYGLAVLLTAIPLVLEALERGDTWPQVAMIVAGAVVAVATGRNRSDQASELIKAQVVALPDPVAAEARRAGVTSGN